MVAGDVVAVAQVVVVAAVVARRDYGTVGAIDDGIVEIAGKLSRGLGWQFDCAGELLVAVVGHCCLRDGNARSRY